jgi:hypothetical protein
MEVVVLFHAPGEDDAEQFGEKREPFDGISVLGIFTSEEAANAAITAHQESFREDMGFKYMMEKVSGTSNAG